MGCAGGKPAAAVGPNATARDELEGPALTASVSIEELQPLDFNLVMDDAAAKKVLLEFAKSEFSEENMLFWSAVMQFKHDLADVTSVPPPVPENEEETGHGIAYPVDACQHRAKILEEKASDIIDTYLCDGADFQVTLPDHKYKQRSCKKEYEYSEGMFDKLSHVAFKTIKQDTWSRFKISDKAADLASQRPDLTRGGKANEPTLSAKASVAALRRELEGIVDEVNCDRATIWVINQREKRLWNLCSTELGNSIISIDMASGLAGKAASSGVDVVSNDVQRGDTIFNRQVDKATSYVTRSISCVVLMRGVEVGAVVQLINKKGAETEAAMEDPTLSPTPFVEDDAKAVRARGDEILKITSGIVMHELLIDG